MEWVLLVLGGLVVGWLLMSWKAVKTVRQRSAQLSRQTGIPAARIEREMQRNRLTPGEWASSHGLDPMTFQPRKPPSPPPDAPEGEAEPASERVRAWAARQFRFRAESDEAQQLVAFATSEGDWPPEAVVWKFLTSQWPIVTQETVERFGDEATRLWRDGIAMEQAVRTATPVMFPLHEQQIIEAVVPRLREAGRDNGWVTPPAR